MTDEGPKESLIKYNDSHEISQNEAQKLKGDIAQQKKKGYPTFEAKPSLREILDAILPPRTWSQDGKHFVQDISHQPAFRDDVANLQKLLDERLLARQAR